MQNLICGKEVLLFRKREEPGPVSDWKPTGHHDDDFRVFSRNFSPRKFLAKFLTILV